MALSRVQWGDTGSSYVASGSAGTVLPANVTVGDGVSLLFYVAAGSANTISAVTSPMGTTLTRVNSYVQSSGIQEIECWVLAQASAAAKTVTVTTVGSVNWTGAATEWDLPITGSDGGLASGSSTAPSIGISTPSGAAAVALMFEAASGVITAAPTAPWTDYNGGGAFWSWTDALDFAYQVAASTGTLTATWTTNPTGAWDVAGLIVANAQVAPTVSTETSDSYGPTVEVLSAVVNPGYLSTTVSFNYGATNSYGSTSGTVTVPAGASPVTVQIPITGLTLGNTYHFQAVATNTAGTTDGADATFTTVGMPSQIGGGLGYGGLGGSGLGFEPAVPVVSAETAFSYGPTVEMLQVNVSTGDQGATVYFNYGATNAYGSTSATYTVLPGQTVVQIPISGLTLGSTYHFQAVVTNPVGTTDGADATFTTIGMPSEIGGGLGYGALGGSGLGFQPTSGGTITTAAISASMVMAATNTELVTDTAAITASAVLAATNKETVAETVAISATSSLSATNVQIIQITCAISCSASVAAANTQSVTDTCAISASMALAATNKEMVADTASISASSSLAATNQELITETCAIAGTSSLSANNASGTPISAAISCTSALSATNSELMTNSAALSGSSSLAAANSEVVTLAVAIAASATVLGTNAELVTETVAIAGTSALSAEVVNLVALTAAITGTSSMSAANVELHYLTAAIAASSSVSATNSELVELASAIAGTSSLAAGNATTVQITAAIAAYLVLAANVAPPPVQGLAYGYIVASLALGSLVAASASGDVLATSALGTLAADSASGDVLASIATGTIT